MSTTYAAAFDEGFAAAVREIQSGSHAKRMSPAEYFWHYGFRFDLRSATRGEQEAVRTVFLAQKLDLDGFTPKHAAIVQIVLGHETEATRMVAAGHVEWETDARGEREP